MNRYGNLAYDDRDYEDYSPRYRNNNGNSGTKRDNSTMRAKDTTVKTGKRPANHRKKKINVGVLTSILTLSLSAAFMICAFVTVNEKRNEISKLEDKLENAESATSQKMFELERSVDLSEIEKEATTRLDMQRPEKYQTIYINVPMDDVTHTTADSVEGMDNSLKIFFNKIISDIIEFFSIK